jgi:hypothetical protein
VKRDTYIGVFASIGSVVYIATGAVGKHLGATGNVIEKTYRLRLSTALLCLWR